LVGGQILKLIFVINCKHPELAIIHKPIIDNPQATSPTFTSAPVCPTQLAETACSRHDITCLRVQLHVRLQRTILIVRKIITNGSSERCGFEEYGSHRQTIGNLLIVMQPTNHLPDEQSLGFSPTKNPALLSKAGLFNSASDAYGAYVSSNSVGTLKSRDIITLNAVMVKIENTNSLRAQTVSSTAL